MTLPATSAATVQTGHRRALSSIFSLALALAVGFTMMGSFGTVQEAAKAELRLTDTSLGVIQGISAALALVICSIPLGILVDRYNRVRLLIALALVWTFGTALTAVASDAKVLFAARFLTAAGTTGALTAALSLTADLCEREQRGRAMLMVNLGKTAGVAAAFAVGGWLFGQFARRTLTLFGDITPWRGTHAMLAVISLAIIPLLLTMREPARQEVARTAHAPLSVLAKEMWSRRAFLLSLFTGQVAVVMADNTALLWAAPVLSRGYGLQPSDFAGWMGALVFLCGLGGTVLGGFAADFGQKSGRRGGPLLGALIAAVVGVPAALFPIAPTVPWFAVAFGVLALCGTMISLTTSVALTVLVPNELRGLCIGALLASAGVIGFGIAPLLVTWVSTYLGGERQLGSALAIIGVTTSAMSVIGFALAIRAAPQPAISHS